MALISALLTLASLAGGAGAPRPGSAQAGATWELRQIAPLAGEWVTLGPSLTRPTLRAEAQRWSGSTGCNGWVALQTWRQPKLHTQRPCTDAALGLEADFLRLLSQSERLEVRGGQLVGLVGGQPRLIFVPRP